MTIPLIIIGFIIFAALYGYVTMWGWNTYIGPMFNSDVVLSFKDGVIVWLFFNLIFLPRFGGNKDGSK